MYSLKNAFNIKQALTKIVVNIALFIVTQMFS